MIERFGDRERGGFFTTSDDHEELIARRKDLDDHPIPSGNASAALGLLRLEALSGERRYGEWAEGVLRLLAGPAERHPQAPRLPAHRRSTSTLSPTREVALIAPPAPAPGRSAELGGGGPRPATARTWSSPAARRAERAAAARPTGPALGGGPAAYVCEHFACKAPVASADELRALLD